jgi:hypothetical protein
MEVSPNVLRKETVAVLNEVNEALELDRPQDRATLLLAKSQCINTLTLLTKVEKDERERRRSRTAGR